MGGRWFNAAVVFLWLGTMTWLFTQKVIPPLLSGEPPCSQLILDARRAERPVGWSLSWNDRRVGWALSLTRPLDDRSTEIRGQVHFDELPIGQLTPEFLRGFTSLASQAGATIPADAQTVMTIDPLGYLSRVDATVSFESAGETIRMQGEMADDGLGVVIRSGGLAYETTVPIDPKAMLGTSLSPETCLPGLEKDQTWTVEAFSPLAGPNRPFEMIQAKVERMVRLPWHGDLVPTWLVVYHAQSGFHFGDADRVRGRLWVRPDGVVLKQEMNVLGAVMTFERLRDAAAEKLMHRQRLGTDE